MPRVPTLQEGAAPAQAPGARIQATVRPLEATGLRAVGQVMSEEARHAVVQVRQTQLEELRTARQRLMNELQADPQNGYQTKRGKDAFSVPGSYSESWKKGLDDLGKTIKDPAVQDMFRLESERDGVAFERGMWQHVSRERQVYDDEVFQNGLATDRETVALNYNDELGAVRAIDAAIARVDTYAERNGKPPEWREARVKDLQSAGYRSVIERHLDDQNAPAAKQWMERYGHALTEQDRAAMTKGLEATERRGQAQAITDELMDRGLSQEAGLSEIRERYHNDPDMREQAEARFLRMSTLKERAEAEEVQNLGRDIHSALIDPQNPQGLDAIPSWKLESLRERDPATYDALRKADAARSQGRPIETDLPTYQMLELSAADPATRGDFLNTNLYQFADRLSPADFKRFIGIQADLIRDATNPGSDSATATLLTGIQSKREVVDEVLVGAGIDPTLSTTNKDREKVSQFRSVLDRYVVAEQQATGKALPPQRIREIAESLMVKVTIEQQAGIVSNIWNRRKPLTGKESVEVFAFESPGVSGRAFAVDDVPEADRQQIVQALNRAGKPVTPTAIVSTYNIKLSQADAD
jgi:hypothetical protein